VKIDKTKPTIRHDLLAAADGSLSPANANGWHKSDVKVHFICDDGVNGSGIASCGPDSVISAEGRDQDASGKAVDNAGNDATDPAKISLDKTPPTITAAADRAANAAGWYDGDVTVTFTCGDSLSGIASCTSPQQVTSEGAGQIVPGTAVDRAGNKASTTVRGINVDKTPPTITGAPTSKPNANGWYGQPVEVQWTCQDQATLSGLATGACPSPASVATEGPNQGAGASVTDIAGNTATGSVGGLNIDLTQPTIAFSAPAPGTTVSSDSVNVTVDVADAGSGVDSVAIAGGPATVNAATGKASRTVALACGQNSVTASVTDKAGHTTLAPLPLTITRSCLSVGDVLAPVATSTGSQGDPKAANLQAFKIKSVVPVKFRLYKDQARTQLITDPPAGSVAKLTMVKYNSDTTTSDVADLVSAGSANTDNLFRWSGSPDYQYIYNLGTTGRVAGTYGVQLTLAAADGSVLARSQMQYFVLRA
jgi:hypothetical protein